MRDPPTEPQLHFLKNLKYEGTLPVTKWEATWLIDARKAGESGPALEKKFLAWREEERRASAKQWIKAQREARKYDLKEVRQDKYHDIVGFIISPETTCAVAGFYAGAWLPSPVALKHKEILPGGKQCNPEVCDSSCSHEMLLAHEKIPKDIRIVTGPGKIKTYAGLHAKKMRGRLGCFLFFVVVVIFVIWLFAGCCAHPERPSEISCLCLRVIDGDTIVLDIDRDGVEDSWEHVRLAGYDAPESWKQTDGTWGPADEPERSRGLAAKKKLEELILGREVEFRQVAVDVYRRMVGWLKIGGRDVNREMKEYCHGWEN